MAKITFTQDDGSVQEFDVTITSVKPTPAPADVEVDVKKSDGSEETFTQPAAPVEAESGTQAQ